MPIELRIPAMGEGITDVTIIRWLVKEGDAIKKDTPLVEIATDKVDSEVLAPEDGILEKILISEGTIANIGETIGLIAIEKEDIPKRNNKISKEKSVKSVKSEVTYLKDPKLSHSEMAIKQNSRFISPFIRTIALQKDIPLFEIENLKGTGVNSRLTKEDILNYIENRKEPTVPLRTVTPVIAPIESDNSDNNVEYIELSRLRKLIAKNMSYSKQVSPHVTSFVEVNLTKIVQWRNKIKDSFLEKYGQKITFLPFIIDAAAKALKEYPTINASLDNDRLIVKKNINIGIATALPDGNLIVPVIKNASNLNLTGITKALNTLAKKAKESSLAPEDTINGTFTITNTGTFGNIGGIPIINQPQLAILAIGEIIKKPVAVKSGSDYGIAIQDVAELWLSYDHRIVDGLLGGSFLKRIANILEQFDDTTNI